ncbi:hypothetical protein EDEG_02738 [Edhazardia aedis USNM 41457]|uniref:ABC transporter domain-containing protein n=1 Tax=Edhazardia aedis (strain USNM 41457) TaxID=1003232 RepID=J8ZT59_EDHAE|nr:hypothetical protein EDEG_02738 [Edhazardia aedis USNM 41457]|eukprot:EJW02858.1 hypothetical protein EDEG_02738 [Edhazardia aedis USNM 41457]
MDRTNLKLTWMNLSLKHGNKFILKNESGEIKPRTLNALLGTSGAGKTSLMNGLSGRIDPTISLKGEILINGKIRDKEKWAKTIAYVEQFFHAYSNQTVYETIYFSAKMRSINSNVFSLNGYRSIITSENNLISCQNSYLIDNENKIEKSNNLLESNKSIKLNTSIKKQKEDVKIEMEYVYEDSLSSLKSTQNLFSDTFKADLATSKKSTTLTKNKNEEILKTSHCEKKIIDKRESQNKINDSEEKLLKKHVNSIIEKLGLSSVKNHRLCQISGGEFKRVSIGVELIGNPSIIFLDEPTSGLDSFNALNIVKLLKRLAQEGKTILMTIHQPSNLIAQIFDCFFIMTKGSSIFQGSYDECVQFFKDNGYNLPENTNPFDYFLDLISVDTTSEEKTKGSIERIENLKNSWKTYSKRRLLKEDEILINQINDILDKKNNFNKGTSLENILHEATYRKIVNENNKNVAITLKPPVDAHESATYSLIKNKKLLKNVKKFIRMIFTWFITFKYLFIRNLKDIWRDHRYLKILAAQKIIFLMLLGFTFWNLPYTEEAIQSRNGVIFFILNNSLFGTAGPLLGLFPLEKRIINRERKSAMYDGFSAYLAKYLVLNIYNCIFSGVYIAIIYWMVNFNPNFGRFLIFLIIQISVIFFSISMGLTIGTFSPTEKFAQVTGTTLLIFFILYGGGVSHPNTIPKALRWLLWMSPVSYAYKSILQNQFHGMVFGNLDGEEAVYQFGQSHPNMWYCILCLWGLTTMWIVIGALALHYVTRISIKI